MSKAYQVAQAFQATVSKEDKTPKTVTFDGNTFNAWKVKLVGEESKGWINVNKKPGNEIAQGDELYGDVVQIDGKFGTFYNFKSASRPLGEAPAASSQNDSSEDFTANVSTEIVHDKLDYIIGMLEQLVDPTTAQPSTAAPSLDDLDI